MDAYDAQERILERLRGVEPEQLEYLCKEVIEEVEHPDQIEVTPFHHDKGIDIQGRTGGIIYNGEFGIQVKQTGNKVGAPTIQQFAGALEVDGCHYGTFVTTSDFTKPARTDVDETDPFSIRLISGDRLAEIMLKHEIGVISQSKEEAVYVENPDFWNRFEVDEDLIPSGKVPQADSLDILQKVIVAVHNDQTFKAEIARQLTEDTDESWTRRQADYYAIAAHALGLLGEDSGLYEEDGISRQVRKWKISGKGEKYIQLLQSDHKKADEFLYDAIRELKIVELVIEMIREEIAIVQSEIADTIREETAVSGSTADRRAKTLGAWLGDMDGQIKRTEEGSQIKYALQADLREY
jgi:restriction system protein